MVKLRIGFTANRAEVAVLFENGILHTFWDIGSGLGHLTVTERRFSLRVEAIGSTLSRGRWIIAAAGNLWGVRFLRGPVGENHRTVWRTALLSALTGLSPRIRSK